MGISAPERVWWTPVDKDEKIWVTIALIFCLVTFFMMPFYHVVGKQNTSSESYRIDPAEFEKRTQLFIQQSEKVGETPNGLPIIKPNGTEVYLLARQFQFEPALQLEKGKTYRFHLSSVDVQHGMSVLPLNMNWMVIPEYDYIVTITPTTTGEFPIVCNEFCGAAHHAMLGKIIVK